MENCKTIRDAELTSDLHQLQIRIQELEKTERDLKVFKRRLEDTVKQRSIELEKLHEQLKQTEKMIAMGHIAGSIAHDFNNLLTSIIGFAELIYDVSQSGSRTKQFAHNILLSARHGAQLTSNLLVFAKEGKYRIELLNVHDIITQVINVLFLSLNDRITVTQSLEAAPATTMGDPTLLYNAFLNIVLNARDAIVGHGELTITTNLAKREELLTHENEFQIMADTYIRICFTDTGIGIDEKIQRLIFKPFFTTKDRGKGIGMGLSAVYDTIKSHKGAITVESTIGKGTTFSLYLPFIDSKPELIQECKQSAQTPGKKCGTILIVDDEETIRTIAREMLTELGYTVITCRDGIEAIDVYTSAQATIDVVILDVVMPQMDGAQTLSRLRTINPSVKIILWSGYNLSIGNYSRLYTEASQFIQKPFGKSELSQCIDRVLGTA
ncbi:MAG: response regulator [Chitinivibrionales bacterium]|nr:response regulator [Chitinivibrionales bacterium]